MTRVALERLTQAHLADVAQLLQDEGVQRYAMVPSPVPEGFERTWLDVYERGRADGSRELFAIVDERGAFLGFSCAFAIDRSARELELGYVVTPEARGRGVGTQALRLTTEWALHELGALRVQLQISEGNEASKRVAQAAGYRYEGTLRSVHFKHGRRDDMQVWSRLASDVVPAPPSGS